MAWGGLTMLCESIKRRRNELGLNQEQIGRACGVKPQMVSRWEKDTEPPHKHWHRLGNLLDVDDEWFVRHRKEVYDPHRSGQVNINTATGGIVNMGSASQLAGKSATHNYANTLINDLNEEQAKEVVKFILGLD